MDKESFEKGYIIGAMRVGLSILPTGIMIVLLGVLDLKIVEISASSLYSLEPILIIIGGGFSIGWMGFLLYTQGGFALTMDLFGNAEVDGNDIDKYWKNNIDA